MARPDIAVSLVGDVVTAARRAGAQAVVTGNAGPNAFNVFQAANVPVHLFGGRTVREAVEAYKAGKLQSVAGANVQAHAGMGMGSGMGMGREGDIASLKDMTGELRKQLAEVMERLDQLEKEN